MLSKVGMPGSPQVKVSAVRVVRSWVVSRPFVDCLILTLLTLFFFRGTLLNTGYPLGADAQVWTGPQQYAAINSWLYSTWEGAGFPGTIGQIAPLSPVLVFLYNLFGSPLGVKLLFFGVYLMAGLGMYALVNHWFKDRNTALISAVLYLAARNVLDQTIQGHWFMTLGMALMPLLLLTWDLMVRRRDLPHIIFAAMAFSLYGTNAHLPYLYVSLFLLFPFFIWNTISAKLEAKGVSLLEFSRPFLVFFPLLFFLSAFFFFPVLFGQNVSAWVGSRPFSLLIRTIRNDSPESLWGTTTLTEVEGRLSIPPIASDTLLVLLPLLSFGLLLFRRDKHTVFLASMAILFGFLAKGLSPPLGGIYMWLIEHVPQFDNQREPARWLFITELCYDILAAATVVAIGGYLRNVSYKTILSGLPLGLLRGGLPKIAHVLVPALLVLAFIAPQWPMLRFGIKSFYVPADYMGLYSYIKAQPEDFVVENLPFRGGSGWLDPIHPEKSPTWYSTWDWGIWSPSIHGKSILGHLEWYPPSHYFLESITSITRDRPTYHLMKIMGQFNVKYVAVLPHAPAKERELFASQHGLTEVFKNEGGLIYENRYWVPRLSLTPKALPTVGGPEAFSSIAGLLDSGDRRLFPLFFQSRNVRDFEATLTSSDTLVFADGDFQDLVFSNLKGTQKALVVDAVSYVTRERSSSNVWLQDDTYALDGGSVNSDSWIGVRAVDSNAVLDIPMEVAAEGDYEIWLRLYFARYKDRLLVSLNGYEAEIHPQTDLPSTGFRWVKVGQTALAKGVYNLKVNNIDAPIEDQATDNFIDEVAVVESTTLASEMERIAALSEWKRLVFLLQQNRLDPVPGLDRHLEASDGYIIKTVNPLSWKIYVPVDGMYRLVVKAKQGPDSGKLLVESNGKVAGRVQLRPELVPIGPQTVVDDKQRSFWVQVNPSEQVALVDDTSVKQNGESSLRLDILTKGRNTYSLLDKDFDEPQDWSHKKYLTFWYKSEGFRGDLGFTIKFSTDPASSVIYQIPESDGWSFAVLPFVTPPSVQGEPQWDRVSKLSLALETKEVTGSLHLDAFTLWDDIETVESEEQGKEGELFPWVYMDQPLHLKAGENTLSLKPLGLVWLDMIALYSLDSEDDATSLDDIFTFTPEEAGSAISYERIDPTHYKAHVKADSPFLLHFSEAYHPLWRAYVDGEEIKPILVNGFFNGYMIDKVGEYDISIKYKAQRYADLGARVSAVVWLGAAIFLGFVGIMAWRRRKGNVQSD